MSEKTYSVSEARQKFLELVRESSEVFDRFVFTKKGKPEAVMLNYQDYQGLLETLEILEDQSLPGKLISRKEEIETGEVETRTHEEVFGDNG
jgi:prevent-host-death family protein